MRRVEDLLEVKINAAFFNGIFFSNKMNINVQDESVSCSKIPANFLKLICKRKLCIEPICSIYKILVWP